MPVPIVFRSSGANNTLYEFTDIASQTGYITLYASTHINDGTNIVFRLSNFVSSSHTRNASQGLSTYSSTTADAFTKIIDLDFDILLNKSMTLRGTAIINVPFRIHESGTGNCVGYILARIRKWDGATETEIASGTGKEDEFNTTAAYLMASISIPITAYTIPGGNYLRITIEGWAKNTVSGQTTKFEIAHDPAGRLAPTHGSGAAAFNEEWNSSYSTVLKAFMPLKIEL